jgi:RHS repeat-associated protein
VTNAGHGHETEVDTYDTDGKHVLSATTTTLAAVCPPSGVAGTPGTSQSRSTYGSFDGELVSELDGDNPVAVCDVQTTRADGYRYDGSCVASVVGGTGPVVAVCGTSGVPHRADLYTHDQYGGVLTDDRQTNGASPWEVVDRTVYTWNDAVSATATSATGTYLIDLPAYTATSDGPDTVRLGCSERGYDGHAYTSGNSNPNLTGGEVTSTTRFTSGCGTSGGGWVPSGPVTTTATYNGYGTPITSDDADANAGNAAHLGCLPGFGTTTYSVCDGVDQTYGALPIWHKDALNQISYTNYDTSGSLGLAGGFGRWPVSTEDFNGQTTTFGYDTLGRMTSETLPGETSGETTESWSYTTWCASLSAANSPCVEVDDSKRYGSGSTDTVTSRAFYDGAGRLAETRSPGPSGQDVVAYADYDAAGHFTFESSSYFVAAYGGAAGPAAYSVPDTTQVGTSTVYDGAERVTSVTDAVGHVTATSYAPAQGLNGDTGYYEATTITDPQGHQRVTLTDAVGRETYDERYTGTAAPYTLYAATKYYYDLLGGLTEILPPNGVGPVTYAYDAAGRKTALSDPDRGNETYMYDADGNLMAASDARGAAGTVYAGYDGLDRLAWRNTTNTSTGAYVTYTYDSTANGNDGVGNLTAEHFAGTPGGPNAGLSGSYAYVYDARGQTTSIAETIGSTTYTAGASYDDAGDLISETYPDGETKSDTYGAQGWLQSVQTRQGSTITTLLSNLTYGGPAGPYGAVTGASVGNGTYTYSAGYDLLLRPTWTLLTRARDGATAFYQSRTYDARSDLTALQTDVQGKTDYQAFCYDDQSRLIWASSASGTIPCGGTNSAGTLSGAQYTQSFTYDVLGRLTVGPLGNYTYGDGAHVHAATAIGSSWMAAYDAAGDMTCRAATSVTTCAGGSPTGAPLTYDNGGQLAQWQSAPGGSPSAAATYLYDGEGNRVEAQTTQNGTTTTTAYIGGLEEVSTTGTQTSTTTYYYAGSQRIALAVNGAVSYLASDQLGTTNVALDANGNTTAVVLDAPYGTTRYASGSMPGSYGFTGQHSDAATTGLDYYDARYYDPVAGQFASADTALDGLDRYEYVGDNPEIGTDPTGHFDSGGLLWCAQVCTFILSIVRGILGAPGEALPAAFRPAPESSAPTAQQVAEGITQSQQNPESGDWPGATGGHSDPTDSGTPTRPGGDDNPPWKGSSGGRNKGSSNKPPANTDNKRPSGKAYGARGGNKRINMFQRVNGVDAGDPAGIYVPAPIPWRTIQLPGGPDAPAQSPQPGWQQVWDGVQQWGSNVGEAWNTFWNNFNQPAPAPCTCGAPGAGGGDDGEGDPIEDPLRPDIPLLD